MPGSQGLSQTLLQAPFNSCGQPHPPLMENLQSYFYDILRVKSQLVIDNTQLEKIENKYTSLFYCDGKLLV